MSENLKDSQVARAARSARAVTQNIEVSLAILERQAEQTNARFESLGDKFDRILERMEQLTLQTTKLITSHDSQIHNLQDQLKTTMNDLKVTQADFKTVTEKMSEKLSDKLEEAVEGMTSSIDTLREDVSSQLITMSNRVTALEKWKYTLVGAGIGGGILLLRAFEMINGLLPMVFSSSK